MDLSRYIYPDIDAGRQPQHQCVLSDELAHFVDSARSYTFLATTPNNLLGPDAPFTKSGTVTDAVTTIAGVGIKGNGTNGYYSKTVSVPSQAMWMAVTVRIASVGTGYKALYSLGSANSASGALFGVYNGNSENSAISGFFRGSDGNPATVKYGETPVADAIYSIVFVAPSTTKASAYLYINGKKYTADTTVSGNTTLGTTLVKEAICASHRGGASQFSPDTVLFTARGVGIIPESLAKKLSENPWQFLKPPSGEIWFAPVAAGSGVTLSGASQSAAYGQIIPAISSVASGQQISSNAGSLSSVVEYFSQLTGLSNAAVAGALAPGLLTSITGELSAFSAGSILYALDSVLSGAESPVSGGSVTFSQALEQALSGLSSTVARGDLVSVIGTALSGGEITLSPGSVAASQAILQALTGLSATASVGELVAALNTSVSGIEGLLSGGTVSPLTGIIAELSGLEASLVGGAVANSVTRLLSGEATGLSAGTPVAGSIISVSGAEISTAANQAGVEVAIGATGSSVILQNGVITVLNSDVTLGLTGAQSTLQYGLLSREIQLALFGQELAISGGQLVAIVEALGLGQSINIMQGSASLSVDKSLSGLVTLSGNGTVVFTDNNLQLALNGQSILTSAGRIFIKGGVLGSSSITILQV